jgi:large subunit ribosomal protein L25
MIQVDMSASKREAFGKCAMRRLRGSGNTPAILYGNKQESIALQLETVPFLKTLFQISRKNAVVNLAINGEDSHLVMVKDIQTDPVDDSLIHADFLEIDLNVPRSFTVGVVFEGAAKGVDLGGQMHVHTASIQIEGMPLSIPDSVIVDVSGLDIGDSVKFSDIKLGNDLTMRSNPEDICIEVINQTYEEEEEVAAE